MTPEERSDLEAKADRALRRGELSQALAGYQALLARFPGDAALLRKIDQVKENLQPAELMSAKANLVEKTVPGGGPEQEGERLLALGDHAGAIAAYRRALKEKPGNELVQERLAELFRLAQVSPKKPSPTDERLPSDRDGALRALLDRIASRRRV